MRLPRFGDFVGRAFESATDAGLEAWADALKARLGLQVFDVWVTGRGDLRIDTLIVPKAARRSGVGTAAMEAVCDFADEHRMRVTLLPGVRDDVHGTTSHARLVRFYKRFGFVENRGRYRDFTLGSGTMLREPLGKR